MTVNYVKRNEINDLKWDACVRNSTKPLIYGISWYLDAAAENNWDGMIINDYEAVFPIPYNRKTIWKQAYTPHSIQQLGPFVQHTDKIAMEDLLGIVNKNYIKANLGVSVHFPTLEKKCNLILPLRQSYKELYEQFRRDRRRDSKNHNLQLRKIDADNILFPFFIKSSAKLIQSGKLNVETFRRVVDAVTRNNAGIAFGAFSENKLISAVFLTEFQNRLTLLLSSTNKKGYKLRANSFLISELIKKYAGTRFILDFEGSEIPGVKDFYKSFGAMEEYYYFYRKENKWVQRVKKILGR